MLYDYIISNYKEGEPIFFSDIFIEGVSRSAVNQQMKSSIVINRENVYVLQLLELLKNIEVYMDGSYDEARVKIEEYIDIHDIRKESVNRYIREFPINVFKNYYELGLDNVFAQRK